MNSCTLHYHCYNVFIKKERRRCLFRTSTARPKADRCLGLGKKHIKYPNLWLRPIWNRRGTLSGSAAGLCLAVISPAVRGDPYHFILLLFSRAAQRKIYSAWQPFRYWRGRYRVSWDHLSSSLNISSFFQPFLICHAFCRPTILSAPYICQENFSRGHPKHCNSLLSDCIIYKSKVTSLDVDSRFWLKAKIA